MARLPIRIRTLRALFTKSGNLCAFPGCNHELVNIKNMFIAEVCHIEAAELGGQRYNPDQCDEQRRSYENLIILCHRHHVETDDVNQYSVSSLKEIKANHEALNGKKIFKVDESVIFQLEAEMHRYWKDVSLANQKEHYFHELSVPINAQELPVLLFEKLYKTVANIESSVDSLRLSDELIDNEIQSFLVRNGYDLEAYTSVPYYENPFINRAWETHNLSLPNNLINLKVAILQIEVLLLEEYLKIHGNDGSATYRFDQAKMELLDIARSATYID